MPSVSTTSAEPQSEDTERLPCLATRSPEPATTKAVAVETLKVPVASPPVPQVSISISRSVPVSPATWSARVRIRTTFWRITCARPISSSTVSPFIRRAVRNAAICALVAAPDMIASIAAAASIRVRSRRSTSRRSASVMMGLVMRGSVYPGQSFPAARGAWVHDTLNIRVTASETEIRLLHVGARPEALPRPLEHDPPVLEHVASVRELERKRHVLLDEHDRHAVAIDPPQSVEDELHRHRRQSEARLVQQKEARARHEPAPDRAHLLLAARQRPGELTLTLVQGPADRPPRRCLAGAVPPDQRHRLAPSHLERDAGDRRQVAIPGLEPVKPEQRGHTRRPGTPRPLSGDWRCRPASPPRSSRRSSARRSDGRAPSPPACCARSTRSTRRMHECRGSAG